jgi:hypothetical protein
LSVPPGIAESGVHVAVPPVSTTWFVPLSAQITLKDVTTPVELVFDRVKVTLPVAALGDTMAVKLTWSP